MATTTTTGVITTAIATADDVNHLGVGDDEVVAWLESQGLGKPRYVFQIELLRSSAPRLRVWSLTLPEIEAIPSDEVVAAGGDLTRFATIDEVWLNGSLPAWWQPEAAA